MKYIDAQINIYIPESVGSRRQHVRRIAKKESERETLKEDSTDRTDRVSFANHIILSALLLIVYT